MEIRLAYGKKGMMVRIPDRVDAHVVEPRFVPGIADEARAVSDALQDPIGHSPLRESVSPGQRVAIVFSDITRATPYHILMPEILKAISHIPDHHITLFCATGTHRPATHGELCSILGRKIVARFRIVQNSSTVDDSFRYAGTTQAGNRILLHREVLDQDLRILTGFIEPHFFAGFSGGGKALMPGMAHQGSIRYNHSIRMLESSGARWGHTRGNPLWEDLTEASEFAGPQFLLNVTLNRHKEITGVFAGDLREAHQRGCQFARESAMAPLSEPFDIVISSNSGYPLDLNIYQSVKGMSAAGQVVRQGGSIVLASECRDGIPGGSDYEKILESAGSVAALMEFIRNHEGAYRDTWQVFFQAKIQARAHVYLKSSLDDHTVRRALLKPAGNLEKLLEELVEEYGKECRVCVLPQGPHTIPFLG